MTRRYVQGAGIDEPLGLQQGITTRYSQADGLGSVTSLTDSTGAIADTYTYDSFGNLTAATGSVTNPSQYTGREFDSETGLYYYRARYYDQSTGRFLSEDPLQHVAGANFYDYSYDNPVNFKDPSGKAALPLVPPPAASGMTLIKGGAAASGAGTGVVAVTVGLIALDAGLLAYDVYEGYHLARAYGYFLPKSSAIPQSSRAECKQSAKDCDDRHARELDFCSNKYWGAPLYGACRDRANWRWNNCRRGLPDPGPLDPAQWPEGH